MNLSIFLARFWVPQACTHSPHPHSPQNTRIPQDYGLNAGATAGGVGGVAVVSTAVVVIFYLRRRPEVPSPRSVSFYAHRLHMGEILRPLSDGGTVSPLSLSITTKFSAQCTCRPRFPRPREITASLCPLSDLAFGAIAAFRDG
jgi:hypothetical protein